jgi:hypothetical protein
MNQRERCETLDEMHTADKYWFSKHYSSVNILVRIINKLIPTTFKMHTETPSNN